MAEVRLDLIKLDGLIRFRSADALLSDPELFGPARDPGRLFSDLLRKAQTSGAEAGGSAVPERPTPAETPAAQDSSEKPTSASSGPAEPEQRAPEPASRDRQPEHPAERSEPTSTEEQTSAADEPVEDSTASGESAAAQLEVSAATEPQGAFETAPDQVSADEAAKPKSDAQPLDRPSASQGEPTNGTRPDPLETRQTETDQQADENPARQHGRKPAAAGAGSNRGLAAKAALGTDEATGQMPAGEQTVETPGKGDGSRGNSDSRTRAPEAAPAVSAPVEQPAVSIHTTTAATPQVSVATAQATQTGQQSGSSESAGPTATQPVAGEGENQGNRATATLRTQTHRSARAAPASPHDGPEGDTQAVDRVRFVQRVARAFEALGQRRGTVRLRLHPPELGSLRLEVTLQRGMMTARLEAETHAARNLLLDNLPALRERLAQQDIRVQQFQVDLMDQPPGGTPDQMPEGWGSGRRSDSGSGSTARQSGTPDDAGASEPRTLQGPGDGARLNVVV